MGSHNIKAIDDGQPIRSLCEKNKNPQHRANEARKCLLNSSRSQITIESSLMIQFDYRWVVKWFVRNLRRFEWRKTAETSKILDLDERASSSETPFDLVAIEEILSRKTRMPEQARKLDRDGKIINCSLNHICLSHCKAEMETQRPMQRGQKVNECVIVQRLRFRFRLQRLFFCWQTGFAKRWKDRAGIAHRIVASPIE